MARRAAERGRIVIGFTTTLEMRIISSNRGGEYWTNVFTATVQTYKLPSRLGYPTKTARLVYSIILNF